jgi:hypothetical protein
MGLRLIFWTYGITFLHEASINALQRMGGEVTKCQKTR